MSKKKTDNEKSKEAYDKVNEWHNEQARKAEKEYKALKKRERKRARPIQVISLIGTIFLVIYMLGVIELFKSGWLLGVAVCGGLYFAIYIFYKISEAFQRDDNV
jgi:hypothetical protein